jgi:hypothetical protein
VGSVSTLSTLDRTVRLLADATYQDPQHDVEPLPRLDGLDGETELDWRLVMALFKAIVPMKFSATSDIREIGYFLVDYGLRHPQESVRVPIREGQALIRAQLGEPELMAYIDPSVEKECVFWTSIWLLRDLGLPRNDLVGMLGEVAKVVTELHRDDE